MELTPVKCGKGHWHRVYLSGDVVYVEAGGGRRRCGYARGALRACQLALSYLAALCG